MQCKDVKTIFFEGEYNELYHFIEDNYFVGRTYEIVEFSFTTNKVLIVSQNCRFYFRIFSEEDERTKFIAQVPQNQKIVSIFEFSNTLSRRRS